MNNITRIRPISDNSYAVTFRCPFCGQETTISVPKVEYIEWEENPDCHVQDIFRSLGPDDRELFITGLCIKCQNKVFHDDEDF